jgi:hypothetical protein
MQTDQHRLGDATTDERKHTGVARGGRRKEVIVFENYDFECCQFFLLNMNCLADSPGNMQWLQGQVDQVP